MEFTAFKLVFVILMMGESLVNNTGFTIKLAYTGIQKNSRFNRV